MADNSIFSRPDNKPGTMLATLNPTRHARLTGCAWLRALQARFARGLTYAARDAHLKVSAPEEMSNLVSPKEMVNSV